MKKQTAMIPDLFEEESVVPEKTTDNSLKNVESIL